MQKGKEDNFFWLAPSYEFHLFASQVVEVGVISLSFQERRFSQVLRTGGTANSIARDFVFLLANILLKKSCQIFL
ncbi:Hypothetical protein Minf_2149 [Methylacidiphilum infernorum V4]|uniref:Uncharacterized protein n=1 Tax=Methylacidiphilum infernorum (isolate V4) TaxID=481448 RepID=B3DZL8_METI4|nr:Hypothetical protein Minf_2149 [Methylacidiphilum infernorum V4]